MPSFRSLFGATGDALRKMQAEMTANKLADIPFHDAPGALSLYHGSPYAFDKFDFESNLKRGEGAMAFGPGGYMTGNRPLAEHYANQLYSLHGRSPGADPFSQFVGGPHIRTNLGALNSYFLDTRGNQLARDEMGNLVSMGARLRSKYGLSMDSNLNPWTGIVKADSGPSAYSRPSQFLPGEMYANRPDGAQMRNPHGTLSGMLGEDKDATLRFLQYKEAERAIGRGMVNASRGNANPFGAGLKGVEASPGWKEFMDTTDSIPGSIFPPGRRMSGGLNLQDWRLTPKNADWAMGIGEHLNSILDPHLDLRLSTAPRARQAPSEKAPYLYTADFNASPNEMMVEDLPFQDQNPRVQGALTDLFNNGPQDLRTKLFGAMGRDMRSVSPDLLSALKGKQFADALPNNLEGMLMMKDAGIPATAFLRAGEARRGGVGTHFDPGDYNFVIHDQDLLSNVRKERLK